VLVKVISAVRVGIKNGASSLVTPGGGPKLSEGMINDALADAPGMLVCEANDAGCDRG
jgi:hypothetical protein